MLDGCHLGVHRPGVETELALNDERAAQPKRGSKAWRRLEWDRYMDASFKFDGLMPVWLAVVRLGVSRQRVHEMMNLGILERMEFYDRVFVRGDEIEALLAMDKERHNPAFRWSEKTA